MGSRNKPGITCCLILVYLAITLLMICTDILFLSELKRYYTDTENIIAGIANEADSQNTALKWLKEAPDASWVKAGADGIAAYGYNEKTLTIWDKKYRSARKKIFTFSAAFELLLLLSFCGLCSLLKKREIQRTAALEKILRQIQDATFDASALFPISPDGRHSAWINSKEIDDVLKDRLCSLQEQIQSDRSRIQQEKEATKSLVTDISHQLKTPVAALKTSLELLAAEKLSPDERQEFLNTCLCQIDGLENLTKALINVSRMEKGLIRITAEPLSIHDTIRSAVSRIYEKALDKHISIEMEETEEFLALHDRKWTTEVFVNILDNAIKYSNENTHITISLTSLIHYIKIEIEDEGIGIPKSDSHKIFQRFYRGESVKDIEGSGIGLYLARSIIEKQHGTIYVRSKTGAKTGSIFSIQLPKI